MEHTPRMLAAIFPLRPVMPAGPVATWRVSGSGIDGTVAGHPLPILSAAFDGNADSLRI